MTRGFWSRRRLVGGGPRGKKAGPDDKRRAPLRKIVGGSYGHLPGELPEAYYEELECGHRQLPVKDLIGETNAARRRCRRCMLAQEKTGEATPMD